VTAVQGAGVAGVAGGSAFEADALSSESVAGAPGVPRLVITEDPQHGVTQYAARLAAALHGHPPLDGLAHLHFTDRLWGSDPDAAASAVERLAARGPVTVTLHDVPQPSDGTESLARRADCYARVVAVAAGVVCNSRHEAALVREFTSPGAEVSVIPLPVDLLPRPAERPGTAATIGLLGYVYPGKGHDRVIRAAATASAVSAASAASAAVGPEHGAGAGTGTAPAVEALGRASDGHERDVTSLAELAESLGVPFAVTGYLSDADLLQRARSTGVPVIAHEHVSASGSLATWIGAGRRPVVVRSRYMEEMAELHRGCLHLTHAEELPAALARALEDPASTWLDDDAKPGPTTAEVAELYLVFWRGVAR
jgi:glycosyltransferase involved in cell wall biosynthesis